MISNSLCPASMKDCLKKKLNRDLDNKDFAGKVTG